MNTTTLDCTGLNCPLPILKLTKTIAGMKTGERLEMIATDPGAVKDVQAWSRQTGHTLVESLHEAGAFRFVILKSK